MTPLLNRSLVAFGAAALTLALAATAGAVPRPPAGGSTAPGQVFAPNPVADLGIETLTDQKGADYFSADPFLRTAYHRVTLTDLDGSGTLTGTCAAVKSNTVPVATNTGSEFVYPRD